MNPIISLAQTHIQFGEIQENLSVAIELIHESAQTGSSLIILPELWSSGYDYANMAKIASQNQKIIMDLSVISRKLNIYIGGSYILRHNDSYTNTFVMIAPDNELTTHYAKIHLFKHLNEDKFFNPGIEPLSLNLPIGKMGISICYDLRFPEFYRFYMQQGVKINIICAEWPEARQDHWNALLTARAIENQCYMAAVNCVGQTGNISFAGQSQIINPWGITLVKASGTSKELIHQEIDMEELSKIRRDYPFQEDANFSLFN